MKFLNYKQIAELQKQLKAKESLRSSMVEKVKFSKETLATHIKNLELSNVPLEDRKASISYYQREVSLNESDVLKYDEEIAKIKERLCSLGASI